jgi:hypothetical protein
LATLNIPSDDTDKDPYSFSIKGTGAAPEMVVEGNLVEIAHGDLSPSLDDHTEFGSADIDTGKVVRIFRILNTGNAALTLDGSPMVEVGGEHAADFAVTANATNLVNAGGDTTFTVTFNPSAIGARLATLNIPSDDTDEDPYNFSIQGTGTDPEMVVEGNLVEIADGDLSPSSDDHTEFGSADIDTDTVVRTFRILNTGNAALTLDGSPIIEIGGEHFADFAVTANATSPVNAGGDTTFMVAFNPSAIGARLATLNIPSDDTDEDPYNFSIQGTGKTKPTVAPPIVGFSSFTVSNLNVKPSRVESGEAVAIVADVTNIGKVGGIYNGVLKINGVVDTTRERTISAGESVKLSFTVTKGAGSYEIDIGGQKTYFEVLPPSRLGLWWFLIIVAATLLTLVLLLLARRRLRNKSLSKAGSGD